MNNAKNNIRRALRLLARRKPACGCESSSYRLSSQLFRLFPTTTDENLVFNDALGTTVGSKSNGKYSSAALTAFGEDLTVHSPTPTQNSNFFTGKPYVEGLGHAFLMRNYRASLSKWQTADPMGYPDGWNQLAYCNNGVTSAVDFWGCVSLNLFRENDFCHVVADKYEEAGYFTVGAHGPMIKDAEGSRFTAAGLAEKIRASGWNGTHPKPYHVLNNGRMEPDKSRPGNFIEFMPE